jgi:hypothetical protein
VKFVIAKSQSAFEYYKRKMRDQGDKEEYQYLFHRDLVRGRKEINIVLFHGFEEKQELLDFLEHYRSYNEVFYELSSVN